MSVPLWMRALAHGIWKGCVYAQTVVRIGVKHVLSAWRSAVALPYSSQAATREFPIEDQRLLLAEYYERFEQLAELICDAAFAGEGTPFQERYAQLRRWHLRAYPQLKPYLTAHLNHDPSDAEFGLRVAGKPTDAIEALFIAETVDEILRYDEGHLIGRLERARSALYRYSDYLRESL
ncbi:MAG: hypothetical protein NZ550_03210 [Fimbriimonadales bacterium]|nr:hypothetical protein [Fimbriimonadales bacterium]MDW8051082.1 hypothetical protein [Armatimonadota bacterium]